jgi:hypothetical protein
MCRFELSRRRSSLEQDIDLSVGSVLHLGETEVSHNESEKSGTTPDETTFSADWQLVQF